jgi:hypothetical protein
MANASSSFAALADPTRRKVFERLSRRALSVGEVAAGLPVSRPARNVYQVNARTIAEMRAYLDRFWETAMAAFKDAVEKETD